MKKLVSAVILLCWMIFIFSMSNKNGEASSDISSSLIKKSVQIITRIKDEKKLDEISKKYSFIVRKSAHFCEYFILAILVMNVLINFGINKHLVIYTSLFCIVYAISDEVHQLFISDRSGQVSDVILDSTASIISSYLFRKIYLRGKRGKKSN